MKIKINVLINIFLFTIFISVNMFPQSIDIKNELSTYLEECNGIIAKSLVKDYDSQIASKIKIGMHAEQLKTCFNGKLPNNIKIISSIEKANKRYENLTPSNGNYDEFINSYITEILKLIPSDSKDLHRANIINQIKSEMVNRSKSIKTKLLSLYQKDGNNAEKNISTQAYSTQNNRESSEKLTDSSKLQINDIIFWWDYIFWTVVGLGVLFISFVIYCIFKFGMVEENITDLRVQKQHRGGETGHAFIPPSFTMQQIESKIFNELAPLKRELEELKYHLSSVPVQLNEEQMEDVIRVLYSESPEHDGCFIAKYFLPQESRRTLYKIKLKNNTDIAEYELLFENTGVHRFAMNSVQTALQPACEYISDPKPTDTMIIPVGKECGVLQDLGDGKYKIIKKIKISFK